ncbi:hypothetical protein JDV09_08055 [Mycobacterium sp. Y57]|uniref:hypothetical protein n=1 Tax=Mycolicibacterium xanthum TaxID=2796469 RepID=UPI001C865B8A|nr:hypothetical protein [Mycolicibacterium xanthum]MBX7432059.1 hypothetical protein [Mycolicibacterium xanthum]
MIEQIDIEIQAPPEEVFQFLVDYDKHYTEVSEDHIERVVNIVDPNLEHPDVSFYFRQISPISGREQKVRGKVTRVEMDKYIGTEFLFPTSLFMTTVEEFLEPRGEGCLLTTKIRFTFIAGLTRNARRKVVEHIRGELEEMKEILERNESS